MNDFISSVKEFIQDVGKGIGRIIILLLDVLLGGIVLSRLLSDFSIPIFGFEISGQFLAWLFSFAFWYAQIILWHLILKDGIDWNKDWFKVILTVTIAIVDTIIDASVVQIWESHELQNVLSTKQFFGIGPNTYDLLMNALLLAVILMTGFGEYLDTVSNEPSTKKFIPFRRKPNNQKKGDQQHRPKPKPAQMSKSRNPTNPRWLEDLPDRIPNALDIPTFLEKYKNV